ncbi:unnamed protein product, partial [Ectocarpus fasciculatus]
VGIKPLEHTFDSWFGGAPLLILFAKTSPRRPFRSLWSHLLVRSNSQGLPNKTFTRARSPRASLQAGLGDVIAGRRDLALPSRGVL